MPWERFVAQFETGVLPHHPHLRAKMEALSVGAGSDPAADMPNLLFYGAPGFPYMPLWSRVVLGDAGAFLRDPPRPTTWGTQKLPYLMHPRYFLFNLLNPDIPKDGGVLLDFLREILPASNIHQAKHIVVIEHVDVLCTAQNTHVLRVLFERYSKNVWFICTTHRINLMEPPIRSRFLAVRVPLPSESANAAIADALGIPRLRTRNTTLMLWSAMRGADPDTSASGTLNYPPLRAFLAQRSHALQDVRDLANTLFKTNIPFRDVLMDLLTLRPAAPDVGALADLEHQYHARKRGHDAIYYELALHLGIGMKK